MYLILDSGPYTVVMCTSSIIPEKVSCHGILVISDSQGIETARDDAMVTVGFICAVCSI